MAANVKYRSTFPQSAIPHGHLISKIWIATQNPLALALSLKTPPTVEIKLSPTKYHEPLQM
jgi:hypothetical protein